MTSVDANRRRTATIVGLTGGMILLIALGGFLLRDRLVPKVVSKKRPEAELVLPAKTPARQVLVAPRTVSSAALDPTVTAQAGSVVNDAVDGDDYIRELDRLIGLTDTERSKMQPFLELIARSQELAARTSDPMQREDMTRRLQYQAQYGMKLRVAPEKRERVAEALQRGVPRLVFPNAKKPNVIKQKVPVAISASNG